MSERGVLALFILPAFLLLVVSQLYPLVQSLQLSFVDWTLARSPEPRGFVGLANYVRALGDPVFREAFALSCLIAIVATSIEIVLGLLVALCVVGEAKILRMTRTVFILPMVIAPVAVGTLWRMLLNGRSGPINYLLSLIGIQAPDWLGQPATAVASIIAIDVWQWTPYVMIVLVAALSTLPAEVYAAAAVDGSGRWQLFRFITLPLLTPAILLVFMFRLVDTFMILDTVYTTTFGGPGFSTHTLSFYIYQQGLRYYNLSYAAATSWLLLLTSLTAVVVILFIRRQAQV